jgi:di/tricarboxylate transporter
MGDEHSDTVGPPSDADARASTATAGQKNALLRPAPVVTRWLPLALIGGVALLLWLSPHFVDASPVFVRGGILVVLTIAAWASGFFAEATTTLLFFLFAASFAIAKPSVIFSGFASPAWWLVLGGAITSIAVERTMLARRLANLLFRRLTGSYRAALTAVAVAALGLNFVMPSSTARVMLLMPIVLALADRLGLAAGRPGRAGLAMTAAAVSSLPAAAILTANVSNLVLLAAADTLYGIKITYGSYLLLHFPIFGALKTLLLVEVSYRLFPEPDRLKPPSPRALEPIPPMSRDERVVAAVLAVSLLFFVTDVVHGISPAWVAVAAGIVCLLPGIGPLPPQSMSQINFGMLVYVAGIFGVGAVIADTGVGTALSSGLLNLSGITPGHEVTNLVIMTAIFTVVGLLTTVIGLPVVLAPLASDFAAASGFPVLSILMLNVPVISAMLFPFQNFLIVIGMQYGGVSLKDGVRFCLVQAVFTVLVLFPLSYAWWSFLGYLP